MQGRVCARYYGGDGTCCVQGGVLGIGDAVYKVMGVAVYKMLGMGVAVCKVLGIGVDVYKVLGMGVVCARC